MSRVTPAISKSAHMAESPWQVHPRIFSAGTSAQSSEIGPESPAVSRFSYASRVLSAVQHRLPGILDPCPVPITNTRTNTQRHVHKHPHTHIHNYAHTHTRTHTWTHTCTRTSKPCTNTAQKWNKDSYQIDTECSLHLSLNLVWSKRDVKNTWTFPVFSALGHLATENFSLGGCRNK